MLRGVLKNTAKGGMNLWSIRRESFSARIAGETIPRHSHRNEVKHHIRSWRRRIRHAQLNVLLLILELQARKEVSPSHSR